MARPIAVVDYHKGNLSSVERGLVDAGGEVLVTDDPALIPTVADEKTVVTHMGNLRSKLKALGADVHIETVWGIGFKLKA